MCVTGRSGVCPTPATPAGRSPVAFRWRRRTRVSSRLKQYHLKWRLLQTTQQGLRAWEVEQVSLQDFALDPIGH